MAPKSFSDIGGSRNESQADFGDVADWGIDRDTFRIDHEEFMRIQRFERRTRTSTWYANVWSAQTESVLMFAEQLLGSAHAGQQNQSRENNR